MSTTRIRKTAQVILDGARRNSPTILTGFGVAGLIATVILAVKATPKALYLIDKKEREFMKDVEGGRPITKREAIQETWACYVPTAIMGGLTIVCIVGANSINLRRNAALMSVYSLAEATLKEYQAKVIETIGEKKEQQIKDNIAQDKLDKHPLSNHSIIFAGGETLCFDSLSGRYFKSDQEKLRKMENDINHKLISEMWVSLNDVYFPNIDLGDEMGWNVDRMVELVFTAKIAEGGLPCLVLGFRSAPTTTFR
jgi:hypothetical protein